MCVNANAIAETFSADIYVNLDSYVITYSGVSGNQPVKLVNAVVVSGESSPDDSNVVGIDSVFTDEGGSYSGNLHLGKNALPGVYQVFVDSENGGTSKRFVVIDESASSSYLTSLNGKLTAEEFGTYLESNSQKFGFYAEDFAGDFSFASNIIFAHKPASGYASCQDVSKAFTKATAVYNVKNSSDTSASLKSNAAILGIDYAEYEALSSESKLMLNGLLKGADYIKDTFETVYDQNLIYAEVMSADRWTVQKERILRYAQRMGYTFPTKYNSISNKDAVFQTVFREKNDITEFAGVALKLNSAIDNVYAGEQKPSAGTGSGGGGAGGGSGFVNKNPVITPTQKGTFADVSDHWAKEYIDELVEKGSISGYEDGTFKPDNTITRAEFTKIIVSVFGLSGNSISEYSDVPDGAWYSEYIAKASANGVIYGSDGMFFPNKNITRQDAALIIYRVLKLKNIETQVGDTFADFEEISDYAKDAVAGMSGIGIISGYDGNFMPNNNITRAEAATMIARTMNFI